MKSDVAFVNALKSAPLLSREHELDLARRWRHEHDEAALHELVRAYMRLVVSIAYRYRHYRLALGDLIQEGNVGLMTAAARFEPEREVRFSTYAVWWIRCAMQEFILRNWSIVRISNTPAQKLLFFNLFRLRAKIAGATGVDDLTGETSAKIAAELKVKLSLVESMGQKLARRDASLNAPVGERSEDELQDFLVDGGPTPEDIMLSSRSAETRNRWLNEAMEQLSARERDIVKRRRLSEEGVTLEQLGQQYGVTKERVRQVEERALGKLREAMRTRVERHSDFFHA